MTTTPEASEEWLLLLAVRLRSRGTASLIGQTRSDLGGLASRIEADLERALAAGQVKTRGDVARWSLTSAGSAELAARIGDDTDRVGRVDLVAAYEAFLPLNRAFLSTLSSSADLGVLRTLVAELVVILDALAERSPRFGQYEPRLAAAIEAAEDDRAWISSPGRDSIHTIWFELHEHLLATLGRDRRDER